MKTADGHLAGQDEARRQDAIEYRALLIVTFPLFFLATIAERCLRRRSYFVSPAHIRRRSVFVETKALANATIPHAFMGW